MSRRAKLATTALFFSLFGWLYIHTGRFPGHARSLEFELASAAEASLAEVGEGDWARVALDGRTAVVSGIAPDETAREEAIAAVSAAVPGGGVGRVIDQTDLRMVVSPYLFDARLEGDRLTLSGYAPDRATRDAIAARAQRVFAGEVDASAVEIASGAPDGADWLYGVDFAVAQLARLRHGVLQITDAEIVIEGEAASAEVRAEVARQLRQAPAPFTGSTSIAVLGQQTAGPAAEELAVGSSPTTSGGAAAAPGLADCQTRIDGLLDGETVRFGFNDAEVSVASRPLLDSVADVAHECAAYGLRISGHTDSTGDPAFNVYLSERRAEAVRDYLIGQGLAPASLEAEGLGESDPVAGNDTPAGRALNRRIEIELIEPTEPSR